MKSLRDSISPPKYEPNNLGLRMAFTSGLQWLCRFTALLSVLILLILLATVLSRGLGRLDWDFIVSNPHPDPKKAGIWPALMGTLWTCLACAFISLPIGIGTAIFLEELRPRNRWFRMLHAIVQANIANLAGVPSVVYGIVGMTAFVSMFGLFPTHDRNHQTNGQSIEWGVIYYDQFLTVNDSVLKVPLASGSVTDTIPTDGLACTNSSGKRVAMKVIPRGASLLESEIDQSLAVRWNETPGRVSKQSWYHFRLPFGRSVLAGSLTLMLVILPVIILSSQEAFRAVPSSLREAALGIGATPWQVVWRVTLPAAIPGIMTGAILAMSRAIGEAAPIMMVSGIVFITRAPSNLMSVFTVLSLQIYDWAGRHEVDFHRASAAGIIVLLVLLLMFNSVAILIRQKFTKPLN
jgi:phosphate transport system permease protein